LCGRRGGRPRPAPRSGRRGRDRPRASGPGAKIRGVISTHVLDTELGEPAAGVKVGLFRDKEMISLQETHEDGRIAELADGLEPGEYRLVFYIEGGFFEKVELTIAI